MSDSEAVMGAMVAEDEVVAGVAPARAISKLYDMALGMCCVRGELWRRVGLSARDRKRSRSGAGTEHKLHWL